MVEIAHRTIEANGIRIRLAEAGSGPLVVLCHGFPESWYSWRHQLRALAEAGYHAVAPDMRGYGETDRPDEIDKYTLLHMIGDMVGVVDALGASQAVIAGHDWGAPVAWHAALLRPDRFRAVIGLSVPFRPRGAVRPTSVMRQDDHAQFYQLYFQTPGLAEVELERDPRRSVRTILYSVSGDDPADGGNPAIVGGFLNAMTDPARLPFMDHGCGRRLLRRRVRPHRLPRRPELVSQHRPKLGTDGALRRAPGHGPGPLHHGRS